LTTLAETTTVRALLAQAISALERGGLATARQDAEWLLSDLLGVRRPTLHLEPGRHVPPEVVEALVELIARRERGEPLQHLLGWEEFCGLRLRVSPEALIPRPETEILVEWALEVLRREPASRPKVIDVGTGCGAIACALAREQPRLEVLGIDVSAGALAVAAQNVRALGLEGRVGLVRGDLLAPVAFGRIDMVISNPPYIASGEIETLPVEVRGYEPRVGLDGGADGMAVHRRLIAEARECLEPGGWLLMEMGERQAGAIATRLAAGGFQAIEVRRDLAGRDRLIGARRG
jgi:release factor glutamine methyltransferase